ncbi:S8 family serine peptidase [Streptomyces sp. MI02-7b]|uniref:S8 family serine peptidase n=1 Tax=Streptomyces sp. MI02-7b TaxID=462941 RepID=UPI0029BE277D|nr:S8 family serine peptidase [Streptomyces sp. MI02-7b]MDX3078087.1 S8 family serine peptidase [Streptomyces sp. MI02-7b]
MSRAHPHGRRRLGAVSVTSVVFLALTAALPASAAPGPGPAVGGSVPSLDGTSPQKAPPAQRAGVVPGQVLVTLSPQTAVTGRKLPGNRAQAHAPGTSSAAVNEKLNAVGATSLQPLLPSLSAAATESMTTSARTRLGADAADLSRTYVVRTGNRDSAAVARTLQGTPGIASAEPNRYVNTMNTGGQQLPTTARASAKRTPATAPTPAASPVPANFALTDSAQAFLNAGGVNAVGAFDILQGRYGQQPGAGRTITNVSVGDLTDQAMADAGDAYVQNHGPTTVLQDGQRYLDLPSMPLIPAYVAAPDGSLSGTASTEDQDPALGEVLLDFSVMAPLAHDRQRPGRTGSDYTDLLGVAPGADYRLVVPQQPTMDQIATALLAAAHQSPKPDVITASLGFGTDAQGFPGRYLEDDPYIRSVVASIVQKDHVVVVISSNDGTRLYTPAAVGPDGGSTPTDTAKSDKSATDINDVAYSTTPSHVPDSGAIAAGGTTLDDTLASRTGPATTAETRISGFGTFSSGFGTRIDLSAPSDNIVAFTHTERGDAQSVTPVLNGGTSASAPEIAAAAAVVLQAAGIAGHHLTPAQVRDVLQRTGRAVPTPAQIDRELNVGRQIDVTAAVEDVLGHRASGTAAVRLSVAHRVTAGALGGQFLETTDPNRIDLGDMASGGNGMGLVGPVTFAGDVTGLPRGSSPTYTLTVGTKTWRSSGPAIRVTPTELLGAAGLPVVSASDRTITVTYRVLTGGRTQATVRRVLTVGPSDGRYVEGPAPKAPAVVKAGHAVTVSYDLSGVATTSDPQLVVSTVGHWNPALAPLFSAAWHQPLTAPSGTVTIPADAFGAGGGLYGIGIAQSGFGGNPSQTGYGEFAPVRVDGGTASQRPQAPLVTGLDGVPAHSTQVTRAKAGFSVRYDVRDVPGAKYAQVEFAAPAPTLHDSLNTFTNANGTALDGDGVDAPSTAHRVLPATKGSVDLDALRLGLSTSTVYGVRVMALDSKHRVVGQASPVSTLEVDDGLAPDGSTVLSFAAAGDDSVAALRTVSGATEVRHYSTRTGRYGPVIASDSGDGSEYEVIGVAPATHRALVVHQATPDGDVLVETWDTARDTLVGRTTLAAADYRFVVGRVDAARSRGAVLLRAVADNSDLVLPVDLKHGTTDAPVPADLPGVAKGSYSLLDIDSSTGDVYLAKGAPIALCLGGVQIPRVNTATRSVTLVGTMSGCSNGFSSDDAGTLYNLSATSPSTKIVPTSVLGSLDVATGETDDPVAVRRGPATGMAVDGANGLAVAAFTAPEGTSYAGSGTAVVADNNATGQLLVIDVTTGEVVKTLTGFQITGHGGPLVHGGVMNSVQLDPATRTGWTYGAYDEQIRQFSY